MNVDASTRAPAEAVRLQYLINADADRGLARGEWFTGSGDLQRLIGRPATPLADVIADAVRANAA